MKKFLLISSITVCLVFIAVLLMKNSFISEIKLESYNKILALHKKNIENYEFELENIQESLNKYETEYQGLDVAKFGQKPEDVLSIWDLKKFDDLAEKINDFQDRYFDIQEKYSRSIEKYNITIHKIHIIENRLGLEKSVIEHLKLKFDK